MVGKAFLKYRWSFPYCLCLFQLLAGYSQIDRSEAQDKPKSSVGIGDVGALTSNVSVITMKEQASIRRAVANGNADTKLQNLVIRMVVLVLNSKLQDTHTGPAAVSDAAMAGFTLTQILGHLHGFLIRV
jgi:hypothetical protein